MVFGYAFGDLYTRADAHFYGSRFMVLGHVFVVCECAG